MSNVIRGALVAGALLTAAAGCRAQTGLNTQCTLVRRLPDGGAGAITEQEVQEKTGSTKDFVSFGSTDCDDLVCVRDATFPKGSDLNAPALGYCSRPCVQGSVCQSDDPALDEQASTRIACRPLLLDEATLAALCVADPGVCIDLGGVRSPFFCARGDSPDAGN